MWRLKVCYKERSGLASSENRQGVISDGRNIKSAEDADNFFEHANDRQVDDFLQHLQSSAVGERENDNDVQRFMNQIGWSNDRPEALGETAYQDAWRAAGMPGQLYHSDNPAGGLTPQDFAKQYFGVATTFAGDIIRHYLSNGYYGGGTYYADSASESAPYGQLQFRGFLNNNARRITFNELERQANAYANSHPSFRRFMNKLRTGYGGDSEALSVYAAMKGYNVIDNEMGYYVVLNRKATTVSRKTKKTSWSMRDW